MNRKCLSCGVFAIAALLMAAAGALPAAAAPPNIVFVVADDLRWNVSGHRGNPIVKTPHLDALAAEGVVFENAFATTSICSVSRATLLTGQWMRRHGIDDFRKGLTEDQWAQTYPERLRAAGYRTAFVGKVGVGDAAAVDAAAAHFDVMLGLKGQGGRDFIDPDDPTRTHQTAALGNQAVAFLESTPADRPFCLSVSFTAVHARDHQPREFQPDDRDAGLYEDAEIPLPPTATEEAFAKLPEFVKRSEGRTRWHWRFDEPAKAQAILKDYYRLVTGLDREIGRMREVLRRRGIADRTVIVFTGDNGYALGDRGLADKWFLWEESIRVPAIVFDPSQPADTRGRRVTAIALNADFAPTLVELAGVPVPERMQGRSLLPWLRGASPDDWRTSFFYEHHTLPSIIPPSEGVRTDDWKYIRWIDRDPVVEELYSLRDDPLELRNLVDSPTAAATLDKLRELWRKSGEALR